MIDGPLKEYLTHRISLQDTNVSLSDLKRMRVLMERRILLENEHPFLLKLVKTFKDKKFVYFLTEYISGSELYDAIRDLGILTASQAQFYTVSMLLAIQSLHGR